MLTPKKQTIVFMDPPYPEKALSVGSYSSEVARMQLYLNRIGSDYRPPFTMLLVDGRFGTQTYNIVLEYQTINGLTPNGIIGYETWNRIVIDFNTIAGGGAHVFPGISLARGIAGSDVLYIQKRLETMRNVYSAIPEIEPSGTYKAKTAAAVRVFQRLFSLPADSIVDAQCWARIGAVYEHLQGMSRVGITPAYPGKPVGAGASGDAVRIIQSCLNAAGRIHPAVCAQKVNGIYNDVTQCAVAAFQAEIGVAPSGGVCRATWRGLVHAFNISLYLYP